MIYSFEYGIAGGGIDRLKDNVIFISVHPLEGGIVAGDNHNAVIATL